MNSQRLNDLVKGKYGRKIAYTDVDAITIENVVKVVSECIGVFNYNRKIIRYLWDYYKGDQPVRYRTKLSNEDIINKIVENHAYEIVQFKKNIVSRCKMFTSEQEGFVPIYKYLDSSKIYNYPQLIAFCKELGMEEEFRRMIILDAIIFNVDRHLGNFGFIVDNETFEILRFAPVFDHNMALLARAMQSDLENFDSYYQMLGHKIGGDFVSVAKKLMTPDIRRDVEELREFAFVPDDKYNLPMERLEFLSAAVRKQVEEILR